LPTRIRANGAEPFFSTLTIAMQVTIKGCTGPVNTFVIEPFVPHKEEFYLCIQSNRLDIEVCVCVWGGGQLRPADCLLG
jgi:hypothetical protein